MLDLTGKKIVKRGICIYGNSKEYEVIIVENSIWYGSGDYEDSPEEGEDMESVNYCIWFDSPESRGSFHAGGGAFLSIEEAVTDIEARRYFSRWMC